MNSFQIALATGAVITAAISWRLPGSLTWILAGAASFVLSTAWARYGLPYPPAFTAACDVAVCLLVYFFAKLRWELAIGYLFQGSVLLSIGYLAGVIESHYAYIVGLEAINWAALLFINATVVTSGLGNGIYTGRRVRRGVRWAHFSLFSQRTEPPFTQQTE